MAATTRALRRVPLPRTWSVRAADVVAVVLGNAVLIGAMWVRHGGLAEFGSYSGALIAVGQLTALYGTYLALLQLVLMSRTPWLDQLFGMDRLAGVHRWVGFACVWLLVAHGVFTTAGFAASDGSSVVGEALVLLTTYPYVLMATAGMALFVAVAVTSVRAARRRVSHETWYGIHLYAYLAIALAFLHQLLVGTDFIGDPAARLYWVLLYVAAVASIVLFRFGQPVYLSVRHRLRVANVVREAPGVVSVYVTGRDLDRLAVRAGQYFVWRFLTRDDWWRGHPFSISAAPNGRFLRLTIKDMGDHTNRLQRMRIGTRVFAEGPYGALTGARRTRPGVVLIAGGIGVTPLRALLEELPAARGDLTLLYRATRAADLVFRDELDQLAALRGATVHYLVGRRGTAAMPTDPLAAPALRRLVPDILQRDVYLCGPVPMMEQVRRTLRALGVSSQQIHLERFAF